MLERFLAGILGGILGGFIVLTLIFFAGAPGTAPVIAGPIATCFAIGFLTGDRGINAIARFLSWFM